MLTIRLSRTGKKKMPYYRIVLQESHRDPWSPAKEILGNYNPRADKEALVLERERIEYWLSHGVQPSNTVHNLLINAGLIKAEKQKSVAISKKRAGKMAQAKTEEEAKQKEAAEAAKAAAEAAKVAAEEEKAAAEAAAAQEKEAQTAQETAEAPVETPAEAPVETTPEAPAPEAAA